MRGYVIYPLRESLALAPPWSNSPAEDKSHNLRANLVDPILVCKGRKPISSDAGIEKNK